MVMQMNQQIVVDYDVPAQMRDGIVLRANVYRPVGEGTWPVLLTRLPYGKDLPLGSELMDPAQVARRGYIVVVQDTRGRMTSEGEWTPFVNEALDGVDTIAWAAKLPWSSGQVGMYGGSYFGFTQWSAATHQPPALKAMVPFQTWNDAFNGLLFRGGALELGTAGFWQSLMAMDTLVRRYRENPQALGMAIYQLVKDIDAMAVSGYASLPLKEFAPLKHQDVALPFFEFLNHPMERDYEPAQASSILGHHHEVTVPTLNIGGWYDIFLQDTLSNFKLMREEGSTAEARQSKLLIGPWTHGQTTNQIGEINFGFGSNAALIDLKIDLVSLHLRWFDHWLKGLDTGLLNEAPIKLFVMGANVWRDEYEWPLARAVETPYYLHSDGHANSLNGDGTLTVNRPEAVEVHADQYIYDPANPVPTLGGALLMTSEFRSGSVDQRPLEGREDMLVYTTDVLLTDVEVTGPIKAYLWATSSAQDTDFVARLVDVHPDGYAQNLTDGIVRARYRNFGLGRAAELLEPGYAYEYQIDLWATSNLFKAGHRIRLDVTSSSFPRWDRNQNTGHAFGEDAELASAYQTILHDLEHPSSLILPIVPAR